MTYRTKVTVVSGGKQYNPGSILPVALPKSVLKFLKAKGFVELAETETDAAMEVSDTISDDEDGDFLDFDEREPEILKTPEEILKIRSKKEVFAYAASIGFDFEQDYEEKSLKVLQEAVINFQEEQLAGSEMQDM